MLCWGWLHDNSNSDKSNSDNSNYKNSISDNSNYDNSSLDNFYSDNLNFDHPNSNILSFKTQIVTVYVSIIQIRAIKIRIRILFILYTFYSRAKMTLRAKVSLCIFDPFPYERFLLTNIYVYIRFYKLNRLPQSPLEGILNNLLFINNRTHEW